MHAGRLVAVVASVACVAVASASVAQDFFPATGRAAARLYARPVPSIARVYAPPAPEGAWQGGARFYFVGEPLTLEMEIWNQAGVHAVLLADDPARGVTVRVRRQEGDDGWFGGRIVDVPVRYHERPDRVYQGVVQPQALDRRMPLAPDEAIRWSADVDLDAMEPGLYVFQLTPAIIEESGIYVSANAPAIAFEMRARTPDAAREIMLRAGRRAMHRGDYPEAERLFHEMRAAFPDSAAATRSLALIYEMQKRPREAREMLERTREILAAGADVALTTHREEYRGEALARQLRALDEQIERLPD